jgi:hypothetical protein
VIWTNRSPEITIQIVSFIKLSLENDVYSSEREPLQKIIWAARTAGFGSPAVQKDAEEALFTDVLEQLKPVLGATHKVWRCGGHHRL